MTEFEGWHTLLLPHGIYRKGVKKVKVLICHVLICIKKCSACGAFFPACLSSFSVIKEVFLPVTSYDPDFEKPLHHVYHFHSFLRIGTVGNIVTKKDEIGDSFFAGLVKEGLKSAMI